MANKYLLQSRFRFGEYTNESRKGLLMSRVDKRVLYGLIACYQINSNYSLCALIVHLLIARDLQIQLELGWQDNSARCVVRLPPSNWIWYRYSPDVLTRGHIPEFTREARIGAIPKWGAGEKSDNLKVRLQRDRNTVKKCDDYFEVNGPFG